MVRSNIKAEGKFLITNHNPDIPYVPTAVQVVPDSGDSSPYETEIVEIEPGLRYELIFRVVKAPPMKFFRGKILVDSEHPSLPQQKLIFQGIYMR